MSLFSGETLTSQDADLGTTSIKGIFMTSKSVTPTSVPANSSQEILITANGVRLGDIAVTNVPANLELGLICSGVRVSAANQLALRVSNLTASPITGAARTWIFKIFRLS